MGHALLNPEKSSMRVYAVDALLDNSTTDFDLFIDLGSMLALYAKAPYKWERDELVRLLAAGHRELYYFTPDQPKVDAYRAIGQRIVIDTTSPPARRMLGLTDAGAELTRILFTHPLTPESLAVASDISRAMVDCVAEDPACVSALGKLANHDDYTYYHSARVAAYALAVCMHLSMRDKVMLTEMALGCLLHDIGKSKIELTILNKRGALLPDEWERMKAHPEEGSKIVSTATTLGHVPKQIILHHHERFDGTGYPHSLTENELLDEVKIASFADIFDALTTNRPYQQSRTPYEALDFIRNRLIRSVHKDSFQAMVELLKAKE